MKIRKATADDIRSMMDLAAESATAAHWTEQQYRDLFSPAVGMHRVAIVAEAAPESSSHPEATDRAEYLPGFLIARFVAHECELENIVVAPSAQRKGTGGKLLNTLLRAVSETNCESVFLEVRESNRAARALYEKLGFKLEGQRKSYYSNPPEDALLYRLAVPPSPAKPFS